MASIFPLIPGTAYQRVNERLLLRTRFLTSRNFKNASKDNCLVSALSVPITKMKGRSLQPSATPDFLWIAVAITIPTG